MFKWEPNGQGSNHFFRFRLWWAVALLYLTALVLALAGWAGWLALVYRHQETILLMMSVK
jgi:hypothetical protein